MLFLLSHAGRQGWNNGPNVLERLTSAQGVVLGRGHHHHDIVMIVDGGHYKMPPLLLSFSCCHMFKGSSTRYKRGPLPPSIFSERHILRGWWWRGYYKVTHDYYYILTYIRYVVSFYNTSAAAGNELICKEKWARRAEPVKLWSLSFTSKVYKKGNF